ncbi:MAG: sigma-70 family RNA polymerase sigma factor [Planctomycetes bacterium]|nr:sigma-70 family RNA polymerase sigma factor [Planctomycetota bacterium]
MDGFTHNPMLSDDPVEWERLIEAVGPPSMLVVLRSRMGRALAARTTPEDLWQETLLHAWHDRARFEWRGLRSFRSWLIQIAENRVRDLLDRDEAAKRGGGRAPKSLSAAVMETPRERSLWPLAGTTTPSRVVQIHEEAQAMFEALESLDDEVREVVRLRLFEELEMEEVASRLELGLSAAKHRFRKGAAEYQRRLEVRLKSLSERGHRIVRP